jgi:HD-GYP domain-containing protein (c-di-GMP phosphodiesterase class II)
MISDRPYRAALTVEEAIEEIRACAGRQFSPRVAEAMLRLHRRRALPSLHVRARAA